VVARRSVYVREPVYVIDPCPPPFVVGHHHHGCYW
jgi:hypothetical protein